MTSNNQPDAARLSPAALAQIRAFQQNEVTEAEVYRRIARRTKDAGNRDTLLRIADEEAKHAAIWQRYTGEEMRPQAGKVRRYALIARVFGFTFAVKLMEKGEAKAQISYEELAREAPEALRHPRRRGGARAGAAGDAGRGAPVVRGQHGAGHERRHGGDDGHAGGPHAGHAEHPPHRAVRPDHRHCGDAFHGVERVPVIQERGPRRTR